MKVRLSNVCATSCESFMFIDEGGSRPAAGDRGGIDTFMGMIHADCLEMVTAWVGERMYNIICDSEGRIKERFPSAVDTEGGVVLVGSLIIVGVGGHQISHDDVEYLRRHIFIATVSGRFCETDITDGNNTYVLTGVRLVGPPEDPAGMTGPVGGTTVPLERKGSKCLRRRKKA